MPAAQANILSLTAKKREAFLSPVSCKSGCFQKNKRWKTKSSIEAERSQNEKNNSHFGTEKKEFKELQEFEEFKNRKGGGD